MRVRLFALFLGAAVMAAPCFAVKGAASFEGRWALTLPGGNAGWLSVADKGDYLHAQLLWGGGSVFALDSAYIVDGALYLTRLHDVERKNEAGEVVLTQQLPEILEARVDGDTMTLTRRNPDTSGYGLTVETFSGKRIPPLGDPCDLASVTYGEPIELFDGESLAGWRLTNPDQVSGWRVEDGVLINEPVQEEGKPHISYGNLRTEDTFEDFMLELDVKVPKDGNSGIYLRGIYEVQVQDSHGDPDSHHNMGAVYSRITPEARAEKPAGEWQHYKIVLCNRHLTVWLNDEVIINNAPLLGVTGGALTSDEFSPGPIYLQGDHTGVEYRDIVLRPIERTG